MRFFHVLGFFGQWGSFSRSILISLLLQLFGFVGNLVGDGQLSEMRLITNTKVSDHWAHVGVLVFGFDLFLGIFDNLNNVLLDIALSFFEVFDPLKLRYFEEINHIKIGNFETELLKNLAFSLGFLFLQIDDFLNCVRDV